MTVGKSRHTGLFLSALGLTVLPVGWYLSESSVTNIFVFAIGFSFLLIGISLIWQFSSKLLLVLDFLYYGFAMLGVIFLFTAQQPERNLLPAQFKLAEIEQSLQISLAEESKFEAISKNPKEFAKATVLRALQGLHEGADDQFDVWCGAAERQARSGPSRRYYFLKDLCGKRGAYHIIRDRGLKIFLESLPTSAAKRADSLDLQTEALRNPGLFFQAALNVESETLKLVGLPRSPNSPLAAIVDLGLALSFQRNDGQYQAALDENQIKLNKLTLEKMALQTEMGHELRVRDRSDAWIQWIRYNVWPILLIIAISIKLARTAHG